LALLAEIPEQWARAVQRWAARNQRLRRAGMPDRNAEYFLYQTLVGAWPIEPERLARYLEKAAREAKVHTSWRHPNSEYERALQGFALQALSDPVFCADLEGFVAALVGPGRINALAQLLLKLTAPGVPDLYQGSELWDLSLVDPDNRRPVDFALRGELLEELQGSRPEPQAILARAELGLPKLWVIRQALALRARRPELFGAEASYAPLAVRGPRSQHAVAFSRGIGAVVLVPRLVLRLAGDWGDTRVELPAGEWLDTLSGERWRGGALPVAQLLARFPVALLERVPEGPAS
jgi:(1->4)-alpha-D-glucan 1-alpha-D-glucosylmutase